MSDSELLELAAKAAGIKVCHIWPSDEGKSWASIWGKDWAERLTTKLWNPLGDDGDAFRLAMALELGVVCKRESDSYEKNRSVVTDPYRVGQLRIVELHKNDPAEATRRAIVRAAAEIGKATA